MAKGANQDIPGNAVGSQAAWDRHVYTHGLAVLELEAAVDRHRKAGLVFKSLRFKAPEVYNGEWLAIITATLEAKPVVAFVFGDDFPACLKTLSNKIRNGSIKWKEDQYG